jgi:hypothetical protein
MAGETNSPGRPNISGTIPAGDAVASGIGVPQWVVVDIRIAVQRLRIPRLRHHRIRTDEPPQPRMVVAGPVVVETQSEVPALADETAIG